jgi:hypothetical protein
LGAFTTRELADSFVARVSDLAVVSELADELSKPLDVVELELDSLKIDPRPAWKIWSKPNSAEVDSVSTTLICDNIGVQIPHVMRDDQFLWTVVRANSKNDAKFVAKQRFERELAKRHSAEASNGA